MKDAVAEYRDLQTSEESTASLDRALKLAMRIAAGQGAAKGRRWRPVLNAPPAPAGQSARERRIYGVVFALSAIAAKTDEIAASIPEDQYSLLMDTLLLVFHQAYFVLLPDLNGARNTLYLVFRGFSSTLSRPEDRFQVLGLVELEEKHFQQAADTFRAAVAATHADAHDFITRVQLLWTVLMAHGRHEDALEVLLDIYPRASRGDLDEITSLLRTTFLDSRPEPRTSRRESRTRKGA